MFSPCTERPPSHRNPFKSPRRPGCWPDVGTGRNARGTHLDTGGRALHRPDSLHRNESGEPYSTAPVETNTELAHTATLRLSDVKPGRAYTYQVELNGTLLPGKHGFTAPAFYHDRTPPPDFTIAVGGAHYVPQEGFEPPYQILGGGNGIFESIYQAKPQLMLWLGNTAHLRVSDWASRSGYLKRYHQARSPSELAPLLANVPQYATWGEADYGSPEADAAYSYREHAEATFRAFWPQPVEVRSLEGLATRFRYADVDFFLLDTRSHRNDTPDSRESVQILGEDSDQLAAPRTDPQ